MIDVAAEHDGPTRRWAASGCTTWWRRWPTRASWSRREGTRVFLEGDPTATRATHKLLGKIHRVRGPQPRAGRADRHVDRRARRRRGPGGGGDGPRRHRQVPAARGVPLDRAQRPGPRPEGAVRRGRLAGRRVALRPAGAAPAPARRRFATASPSRRAAASWASASRPRGAPRGPSGWPSWASSAASASPSAQSEALRAARANPQLMGDLMRRAFEDWLKAECERQPAAAGARRPALGRRRHGGLPGRGPAQPAGLARCWCWPWAGPSCATPSPISGPAAARC